MNTNIYHIADLHLDFYMKPKNLSNNVRKRMGAFIESLLPENFNHNENNIAIIAGDIGHYNEQNKVFLKLLTNYFSNVIFVLGNHDLYLISRNQLKKFKQNSYNKIKDMADWADTQDNIFMLDSNHTSLIEIDNINFVGGKGMWGEYFGENEFGGITLMGITNKHIINDTRYIKKVEVENMLSHEFETIKNSINKINNNNKTILINHYKPHSEYNPADIASPFYQSNLIDYLKDNKARLPDHIIYGHSHDRKEYYIDNIYIHTNSLGYPFEYKNKTEPTKFQLLNL